ncbi:hypothetical protein ACWD7T_35315 [Streptomyces sp. 900116325]
MGQHKSPIIDTVNAVSKDVMIATENLLKSGKVNPLPAFLPSYGRADP